jgi:hypothetical protein
MTPTTNFSGLDASLSIMHLSQVEHQEVNELSAAGPVFGRGILAESQRGINVEGSDFLTYNLGVSMYTVSC